jgi:hypothetical protein
MALSGTDQSGVAASDNFQARLELSGTLSDLKRFVDNIKTMPRVMKLTGIEIVGGRTEQLIQASVTVAIYFQPLPATIGAVDQPIPTLSKKDTEILESIRKNIAGAPGLEASGSGSSPKGKSDPFQ